MFVFHTPEQTVGLCSSHGNHLTCSDCSNDSELHPNHGTFLLFNLFAFLPCSKTTGGSANPGTSVPDAGEGSGVEPYEEQVRALGLFILEETEGHSPGSAAPPQGQWRGMH